MVEMWKFIDGFEDYQVSNYGNVKRTKNDRYKIPTVDHYGYKTVNLQNKLFKVHRLVAIAFCDNPENKDFVDHINRDRLDNHYTNLRFCTRGENNSNKSIQCNNTSSAAGVVYDKSRKKWQARIGKDGKHIFIGRYKTKEEAIEARLKKEKEIFGEFAPN